MAPKELQVLRDKLGLSRAALARFLGVAEMTVVRWESGDATTPKGLVLTVLTAVHIALENHGGTAVTRIIRESAVDHGRGLRALFELAYGRPQRRKP
jgi:DNA-binding XRE family transcriptional regulator